MRAVSDKRREHSHRRERYRDSKRVQRTNTSFRYNINKSLTGRQPKNSDNEYRFLGTIYFAEQATDKSLTWMKCTANWLKLKV